MWGSMMKILCKYLPKIYNKVFNNTTFLTPPCKFVDNHQKNLIIFAKRFSEYSFTTAQENAALNLAGDLLSHKRSTIGIDRFNCSVLKTTTGSTWLSNYDGVCNSFGYC